jgi:hypothetical protein
MGTISSGTRPGSATIRSSGTARSRPNGPLASHVEAMPDEPGTLVRVVDAGGALLAVARRESGPFLQPVAVLM